MSSSRIAIVSGHLKVHEQTPPSIKMATRGSTESPLTTHVLDTSRGRPAQDLPIALYRQNGESFQLVKKAKTNADGRCPGLLTSDQFTKGIYRLTFNTKAYFTQMATKGFYPYVETAFSALVVKLSSGRSGWPGTEVTAVEGGRRRCLYKPQPPKPTPQIVIVFEIDDPSQHYHVPLLLSPYSYSTYRGS